MSRNSNPSPNAGLLTPISQTVRPHPPITRALKEVVTRLREIDNIEVVDWEPYKHGFAWELIVSFVVFSA